MKNLDDTEEIIALRKQYKTWEDYLAEMDFDDEWESSPPPSPTLDAASVIGVKVPSK